MKTKEKGGGGFHNRLLFVLKEKLGDNNIQLQKIKQGKWMLQIGKDRWFLKLFPNSRRFQLQKSVTKALHLEGFSKVPGFHPLHETDNIEFDGRTVGLTEWIDTNDIFTYTSYNERQAALTLLKEFHQYSGKVLSNGDFTTLPMQRLLNKWSLRLDEFRRNKQKLSVYVPPAIIDTYIKTGEKALQGLDQYGFSDQMCILHGDVAHHNFLRGTNNELFMIDLDLITSGPPEIDYIQFANRIFPYINWSLEKLWEHEPFSFFQDNMSFLYSILYPSDVFREWNRFFRGTPDYQKSTWNYLMALTVNQFHPRMVCCRDIQKNLY
ncbi:aminoglycoside phosphotransferase family protein [Bacillus sp. SG-1]|uniref:aminoglycoside phosphotransferase family protein n=1 Tax=Bacillus sp. SG-1 TaxID=161544 RepID=UPI0002F7EEC3|nr:aminoglycoside phosphotransferase family protein [Bacillus sp. SG-1]